MEGGLVLANGMQAPPSWFLLINKHFYLHTILKKTLRNSDYYSFTE